MSLDDIRNLSVGKGFLTGATPTQKMCEGCGMQRAAHIHHKEHKAMGGRKGAAKQKSEAAENKIALCEVCHAASHGILMYGPGNALYSTFWCGLCIRRKTCFYGAQVMGKPTETLKKPW